MLRKSFLLLMAMASGFAQTDLPGPVSVLPYAGSANQLYLWDSSQAHRVGLIAPASVAADITFTLPGADGSSGQCWGWASAHTLGWVSCVGVAAITPVTTDPSGSCTAGLPMQFNTANGNYWGCDGSWIGFVTTNTIQEIYSQKTFANDTPLGWYTTGGVATSLLLLDASNNFNVGPNTSTGGATQFWSSGNLWLSLSSSGYLLPQTTSQLLGSTGKYWGEFFSNVNYLGGLQALSGSTINLGANLIPTADNTYNIGSTNYGMQEFFGYTFYGLRDYVCYGPALVSTGCFEWSATSSPNTLTLTGVSTATVLQFQETSSSVNTIIPVSGKYTELGTTSLGFDALYVNFIGGSSNYARAAFIDTVHSQIVEPSSNNTGSIGLSSNYWNTAYITTLNTTSIPGTCSSIISDCVTTDTTQTITGTKTFTAGVTTFDQIDTTYVVPSTGGTYSLGVSGTTFGSGYIDALYITTLYSEGGGAINVEDQINLVNHNLHILLGSLLLDSGQNVTVGGTSGVSCSGAPSASFASSGGIVTHC